MTLEHLWETLRDVEYGRIKAKQAMETITLNVPSFNGGYAVLCDGWRDARKELPDKDGQYLIHVNCGDPRLRTRTTIFVCGLWSGWQKENVIAWMPLSEIGKPAFA